MKFPKGHSLWMACAGTLALFFFVAGTSLACLQMGAQSATRAKKCCQGHCQHAMAADMAAKCCQSHQAKTFRTLPASSSAKTAPFVAYTLHVSLIPPVVLQGPEQFLVHFTTGGRPPPSPPLYTLYCALLI